MKYESTGGLAGSM